MTGELKDGDIVSGRPVRILSRVEAQLAAAADGNYADRIHGRTRKGSEEAKQKMAKLRAKRKPKAKQHSKAKPGPRESNDDHNEQTSD